MLRLMGMTGIARGVGLVVVVLSAACTSSSHGAASPPSASPSPAVTSSDTSKTVCAERYPAATATESSVAGDLRFFGPRPVAGKEYFSDLPDAAPVALCLVPDGKGEFAVYGILEATHRGQRLWTQNHGGQFYRPG